MKRRVVRRLLLAAAFLAGGIAVVSSTVGILFGATYMLLPAELLFAGAVLLFLLWAAWSITRKFLWRVGRRLAFSYFLIGVLPIPMLAALVLVTGYLVAGFFLGHLYRDTVESVHEDLQITANSLLESFSEGGSLPDQRAGVAVYLNGRRVMGDADLPSDWLPALEDNAPDSGSGQTARYYAREDGSLTLIATAVAGNAATLVTHPGGLSEELMRRGRVWVQLFRSDDPRKGSRTRVSFGGKEYSLQPVKVGRGSEKREQYFAGQNLGKAFIDRPWLWWTAMGEKKSLSRSSWYPRSS